MGAMKEAMHQACEDIERIRCELECWYRYNRDTIDGDDKTHDGIEQALETLRSVAFEHHTLLFGEYVQQDIADAANVPDWVTRKGHWEGK